MKQTAVEWLWEQIENKQPNLSWYKIFEQAKEMEKQQIINAHNNGQRVYADITFLNESEQYYKETFNLSQQDKP
jgi:hypothetical protein